MFKFCYPIQLYWRVNFRNNVSKISKIFPPKGFHEIVGLKQPKVKNYWQKLKKKFSYTLSVKLSARSLIWSGRVSLILFEIIEIIQCQLSIKNMKISKGFPLFSISFLGSSEKFIYPTKKVHGGIGTTIVESQFHYENDSGNKIPLSFFIPRSSP